MKLSNKLLIGLSFLVYIVPLSAYISNRTGSVDAEDFYRSIEQESKSFNSTHKYLKSEKVNPFTNIQLIGNEHIQLHLIKDEVYGLKIVENKHNDTKVSHGANEELIVHIHATSYNANQVFIYAPSFNEITINGIKLDNFVVHQDSINFNVIGVADVLSLGDNETLKYAKINFTNSKVNLKGGKGLQHLILNLNDSEVASNLNSFNYFSLTASNSKYAIVTPEQEDDRANQDGGFIKTLSVNTEGNTLIKLPSTIKIEQIEGRLSDSTYINLPIASLKKLIK